MTLRKLASTLAVVVALAPALAFLPAHAAPAPRFDISLTGGLGLPTGDFADENKFDARSGPQAGIDLCMHVSDFVAVGVDASWNRNKHGAEGTVETLAPGITETADKDRFNIMQFGAHAKYLFPASGKIEPYGMLGVGVYSLKEDYQYTLNDNGNVTVNTDEDDVANGYFKQPGSKLGGKLGVGATYMASPNFGIGLGMDMNRVFLDKKKDGASSASYFSIRGRITYHTMKH